MFTAADHSDCGMGEVRIEYRCPPGSRPADVHWQREEWYEALQRAFIYHRQRRDNAGAANLLFAIAERARELSGDFALRPEEGFADALLKFAHRLGPDVHAALVDRLYPGMGYRPMCAASEVASEARHRRHVPFLIRAAAHAKREGDTPASMAIGSLVFKGRQQAGDPYALVDSVIRCYFGDAAAWPAVTAALADPDPLLRRGAALAMGDGRLAHNRDDIVPSLRAALASERDPDVLDALICSLAAHPSPEQARLIRPFEQVGATRVAASIALMRIDAAMLRLKRDARSTPS